MIDVDAKVRIRHGLRKGQLAQVIDTNFKDDKTHLSLARYRVRFVGGDTDWYEAAALEELPKLSDIPSTSKHYG